MHYFYLTLAILLEVTATTTLKATREFTEFWPSIIVITGYVAAFFFLTLTLRHMTVGVTYAIWSGAGIVLIALTGVLFYNEVLDLPAVTGMALIIAGVFVIHFFSKTSVY
jgi:small multidrug resistance pump